MHCNRNRGYAETYIDGQDFLPHGHIETYNDGKDFLSYFDENYADYYKQGGDFPGDPDKDE